MIETERYFNDMEDSEYDYYAVIDTATGKYMGGFCDPNHFNSLELAFKNAIPMGDMVKTHDLVLIQITDPDEAERIQILWDTPGETPFLSDWQTYPIICESNLNESKGKSTNQNHKTGIPEGYQKRASIVEIRNERPEELVQNSAGLIIQNIFSSGKTRLDPSASREVIDNQVENERATQVRIVFRGEFINPAPSRLIQCIRVDGKFVGRHIPAQDELAIECTFTDYCRGGQSYQIQLNDPNTEGKGFGMINNSLIIEEV